MRYRWVEHTAELELEIDAVTEEDVFAGAVQAVGELLRGSADQAGPFRELALRAEDRGALLVALIDELVYLAETEDLVPIRVEQLRLSERALAGRVRFSRGAPRHLIKGATYHRLTFHSTNGGYRARVVLDV